MRAVTLGFPRMHQEAGERRDFLPGFVEQLSDCGAEIVLEEGYGSGMGYTEDDYRKYAPGVRFASLQECYQQEIVLVLRYPGDEKVQWMQQGSCLISMMHYPTRPNRVRLLRDLNIEAISLDSVKDDVGRRMIENLNAVGWNGVEAAFDVLSKIYPEPGIEDPKRNPIKVTVMGAGAVGTYAIHAAMRYGNEQFWHKMAGEGVTGVQVTVAEYDLTCKTRIMEQILKYTDILIDATQRPDPSKPVIPNTMVGVMRPYAVLLDLSVDPYECTPDGIQMVKGIEGVPQGNLDQYVFAPDDPAWDMLPPCVDQRARRWAVSCYSWPGVRPKECMDIYGKQIAPLMQAIIESGGVHNVRSAGGFFHRAVSRATLSSWLR